MTRPEPTWLTVLALAVALAAAAAPAHAEPGDAFERLAEGGAIESLVLRALAGVDVDALLAGFEQSAEALAEGRPVDAAALARTQRQIDRQMQQAGPELARGAAGVLAPLLRELRTELGRELAGIGRD